MLSMADLEKALCSSAIAFIKKPPIIINALALLYVYFESAEKIQVERMSSTLFRETSVMAWDLL